LAEIAFDELYESIKNHQLNEHNIYNADLNLPSVLSAQYYRTHSYDNPERDQAVSVVFIDIEVYTRNAPNQKFDFKTGDCPLSAITLYSTSSKSFYSMLLLNDINKEKFGLAPTTTREEAMELITSSQSEFKDRLVKSNHIVEGENLYIQIFNDELTMITKCWEIIRKESPVIISGWNCDLFDLPYFYSRIAYNWDKETACSIMSEFNFVELRNGLLKIAEYSIMDLLRAYKPRSEGGMNYGKTLQSYSLDFVSNKELGLEKHKFDGELDELYEGDPSEYLFYNIVDVALCVRLNEKLQHLDLHNGIRRRVKAAFTHAMVGSSALFETFIFSQLSDTNQMVRCGMGKESQFKISKEQLDNVHVLSNKKGKIAPETIIAKDMVRHTRKFDGAYVTESYPRIIKGRKLIIDMDAASLYPSMIMQHNISFDSYRARVFPDTVLPILRFLEMNVGRNPLDTKPLTSLQVSIASYVKREKITPQAKTVKEMYYIAAFLINQIFASRITMDKVYRGDSNESRTVLMKYLLPLLDLLNTVSEKRQNYNHFIYDYTFGKNDRYKAERKQVYILKNANSSGQYIECMTPDNAIDYISQFSTTLAGVCCTKHEDFQGMFTGILVNLKALRTEYRAKAATFPKGSTDYQLYNNRQASIKVLMNSVYGVYGLSSYRYSNQWLAQAITTQGRLTVKLAQYLAEQTMKQKFES